MGFGVVFLGCVGGGWVLERIRRRPRMKMRKMNSSIFRVVESLGGLGIVL